MNALKILVTGGSGFIGTNLISSLLERRIDLINIDKSKPKIESHLPYWIEENILNMNELLTIFDRYKPTVVIHLAARTDTTSSNIDDYVDNTIGTKNVLDAAGLTPSIERIIITSSQYVYFSENNSLPTGDTQFSPHTTYGESKVITEKYTRDANLECSWTIIRPTNVWGPWHMRYPDELLKMINQRLYLHPGKKKVIKSYAYVKNVVYQIIGIIYSEKAIVNQQVFYLGDYPIDSYEWVNTFSLQLTHKNVIIAPRFLIRLLGFFGDILDLLKIKFPLTSKRFLNMTDDYLTPMEKTISQFGLYSDSISDNANETIEWLYGDGNSYFPYWQKQKKGQYN